SGFLLSQWKRESQKVTLNGSITGSRKNLIEIKGDYFPFKSDKSLDVNLKFTEFNVDLLQPFLVEFITELKGKAGGTVSIKGTLTKPLLKGKLNLAQTSVRVPYLNSIFKIESETFIMEPDWMGFNHITITDEFNNKAKATGTIF